MSEPLLSFIQDETTLAVTEGGPGGDTSTVAPEPASDAGAPTGDIAQGMIPGRSRRRTKLERVSMRTLATGGIVGIATALGAVLVNNDVAGWIVGLAVGVTSVILAAVLWSSRQL
jgi:hypothetical protein